MKGYNDDLDNGSRNLLVGSEIQRLQTNARDLNYQKAFIDAIMTSKTTLNTQIKGQTWLQ